MISPILKYNSEMWGVYAKPDFQDQGQLANRKDTPPILQTFIRGKQQGF